MSIRLRVVRQDPTGRSLEQLPNASLRRLVERIISEARVAMEKAVLSFESPGQYPIAESARLERIFLKRFRLLPSVCKRRALNSVMSATRLTGRARARLVGELAQINLQSPVSIQQQARQHFDPTRVDVSSLIAGTRVLGGLQNQETSGSDDASTTTTYYGYSSLDRLDLRLHRVKCIDETGRSEWTNRDKIYLGGSKIDSDGTVSEISAFEVGRFNDGDVEVYSPPRSFASFSLTGDRDWPRTFFVLFVLAEIDMGGLADFLDEVANVLRDEVIAWLQAHVEEGMDESPEWAAYVIGITIAYAVTAVFEMLRDVWTDDIFSPVTVSVELDSARDRFDGARDSGELTEHFMDFHGEYSLRYDWQLS